MVGTIISVKCYKMSSDATQLLHAGLNFPALSRKYQVISLSYLVRHVSGRQLQSRGAPLLAVHRGRHVAAPGAGALTPAAQLLSLGLSSILTASAVPAQLRWTMFLGGFPHGGTVEGTTRGVVS